MCYIEGVVYDPPSSEYPPVVVIFRQDGEILAAHAAATLEAAKDMLADIKEQVQEKLDLKNGVRGSL
jgi:hypothetical protein